MRIKLKKLKKPFIIAELSANHNGKITNIFKLIDKAKECGANAVKIQSYTPKSITLDCKNKYFYINSGPWKGNYLYDLYKKGTTPFEWHKKIFDYSKKKKILCFSTPFDLESVNILEKLKTKLYKVASFEINHIPLLEAIGKTKKPVIVSTGMASLDDIKLAIKTLKENGSNDIALLHCISSYPSKVENYNINFFNKLKKFNLPIGLSDHSIGNVVAVSSIGFGAMIFEKHIKLDGQIGIDSKFSTSTKQFKNYINDINLSFNCYGDENFTRDRIEGSSKRHRRSIFISKNVLKNEKITPYNIAVVRPSNGIHPKFYKKVIGKKFKNNKKKGTPLKLEYVN